MKINKFINNNNNNKNLFIYSSRLALSTRVVPSRFLRALMSLSILLVDFSASKHSFVWLFTAGMKLNNRFMKSTINRTKATRKNKT